MNTRKFWKTYVADKSYLIVFALYLILIGIIYNYLLHDMISTFCFIIFMIIMSPFSYYYQIYKTKKNLDKQTANAKLNYERDTTKIGRKSR